MGKYLLRRPSPALAVAFVALLVALGGTSLAAFSVPRNSVGTKQLRKNAVTTRKIKNRAVTASKINVAGLTVPDAIHANTADTATNATNADHASNADNATNADNAAHATTADSASNANTLDNLDSSAFLPSSSRGVAVAAARVTDTGTVLGYFNRLGGAPTVSHTTGSGTYTITFPGNDINVNIEILQATISGGPGEIGVDSVNGNAIVKTFNSSGAPADLQFTLVVFPASLSG